LLRFRYQYSGEKGYKSGRKASFSDHIGVTTPGLPSIHPDKFFTENGEEQPLGKRRDGKVYHKNNATS
jgi:hypothetical protein